MMGRTNPDVIFSLMDSTARHTFARQASFKTADLLGQAVIDLLRALKYAYQTGL